MGGLRFAATVFFGLSTAACQSEQAESSGPDDFVQWTLPDKLSEISGLALSRDERLFAITDEEAIVYEIDYRNGSMVKAFAIGEPTVRDDFEGIAFLGDKIWLMTSRGRLYSFDEGRDGERVAYERVKTGLGDECEFEGLTADQETETLLLVCKESRKKSKGLRIIEWSATNADKQSAIEIDLDTDAMTKAIGKKRLNPSGITIDPATGNRIVVAGRQRAVFELSRDGHLLDVIMRLDSKRHRQSEGISITADGRLLLADEANKGPARLAVYNSKNRKTKSE